MTVKEFCKEYNLTDSQFYGREIINTNLYLESVIKLPKGFNPRVGGSLYSHSVKKLPEGFSPTVEGHLYLDSVKKLPKGFNPKIGGSLDLSSVKKLPKGFSPKVGGYLYLDSVIKLPKGFNPICIDVCLSKGWINLDEKIRFIDNFVIADGIVTEIVSQKGNVYKVKKINSDEIFYLLITEEGIASHGKTYKEAKDSLIYKLTDKDLSEYEDLTLSSEISHSEAIQLYRKVTGACEYGTRNFVESNSELMKESYKISELINITKGHYGNEALENFFNR